MKQYWVTFILRRTDKYTKETKVWSSPTSRSLNILSEAHREIRLMRENNDADVISAWIDTYDDNNNKTTVFHDCYINFVGNVETLKSDLVRNEEKQVNEISCDNCSKNRSMNCVVMQGSNRPEDRSCFR